jgi:hypothetical protein
MWRQVGVGAGLLVVLLGSVAGLLTKTAAAAESKPLVILASIHNVDFAEASCSYLLNVADVRNITRVLNNPSDFDPEDVKFNKQLSDGIWECRSVKDRRELGRRLENNIMDQLAVNTRCAGVSAYIEGYDKFDGKFNAAAMQAEEGSGYWSLMVNYAPGSKVHGWSLFPVNASGTTPSDGRMISGEGTVSQIAEQVCIVVTRHGASIR